MILYPRLYIDNVRCIKIDFLNKNNIKAIILDMDNTIIDLSKNIPEGTKEWVDSLKKHGIKFCIVSNSIHKDKVIKIANELGIDDFILFAKKPLKSGFKKAMKILNIKPCNIAAVGDQIFTDVVGANRCGMYSILVKPIDRKDILITKIKRPIENYIINKYLKKKGNKNVF